MAKNFNLADLRKAADKQLADRLAVTKRAMELANAINEADAEIKKATKAEDAELVVELTDRKLKNAEELRKLRAELTKPQTYEIRDAALDRWNTYAGAYNAEFTEAYKKYQKDRKALCEAYMALVEMQREALANRQDLRSFEAEYRQGEMLSKAEPLEMLETGNGNLPELDFVSAELPGHRYFIKMVAEKRQAVTTEEMDDRNTNPLMRSAVLRKPSPATILR